VSQLSYLDASPKFLNQARELLAQFDERLRALAGEDARFAERAEDYLRIAPGDVGPDPDDELEWYRAWFMGAACALDRQAAELAEKVRETT